MPCLETELPEQSAAERDREILLTAVFPAVVIRMWISLCVIILIFWMLWKQKVLRLWTGNSRWRGPDAMIWPKERWRTRSWVFLRFRRNRWQQKNWKNMQKKQKLLFVSFREIPVREMIVSWKKKYPLGIKGMKLEITGFLQWRWIILKSCGQLFLHWYWCWMFRAPYRCRIWRRLVRMLFFSWGRQDRREEPPLPIFSQVRQHRQESWPQPGQKNMKIILRQAISFRILIRQYIRKEFM